MSETDLYKELLDQLQACTSQEEREWLSLHFSISRLSEQMRNAVRVAAVPRFFDRAFLNALLDQPLDEAQFSELTEQSYIEPYPGEGRFNVHERSRKLLQEKLWQEDEALYRELSRRALAYCAAQDRDNTTWRIETVYHQLIAEPNEGVIALNNTCVHWMRSSHFAYDKAESLLRAVQEHQEMKRLVEKVVHYFLLRQAQVDIYYNRYLEAKQTIKQIPFSATKNNELAATCLHTLGRVHIGLSELLDARHCCEESLMLYREKDKRQGEANCLRSIGHVHFRLSEFSNARQRYKEALPLYQKSGDRHSEANCLKALGDLHISLSELPVARQRYEKALLLYQKAGDQRCGCWARCLETLGNLHLQLSEFPDARQRYDEALRLYREIDNQHGEANCLRSIGDVHLNLSELPEARQRYEKALQLYREKDERLGEANCLRSLGELCQVLFDIPAAQQHYKNALQLSQKINDRLGEANCLQSLGKVHMTLSEFQKAQECYEEALRLYQETDARRNEAQCLLQLCFVHFLLSEYQEAWWYCEEALTLYRQIGVRLNLINRLKIIGNRWCYIFKNFDKFKQVIKQMIKNQQP